MKTNRMQKFSLLTVALTALTLSSCSKEDGMENAPGAEARISISFVDNVNTRVVTDAVDTEDQVINDASIFVFRPSGVKDVARKYLTGFESDAVQTIDATTAAKRVYVVSNIGDAAAHDVLFSAVTDEASLNQLIKDRITDLSDQAVAQNVLMTGQGLVSAFSGTSATVNIALAFPLAKIRLIVKNNRINNLLHTEVDAAGKVAIIDSRVVLINAGKSIKFFTSNAGVDQAIQSSFYTGRAGVDVAGGFNAYFSDDAVSSKATWLGANDGTSGGSLNSTVTHHFYTAANDGANNPTILAIESTSVGWDVDNAVQTAHKVYYPIQFTTTDAGTTLKAGESYTVTLNLTGDIGGGGGGGVIDPIEPVVDGTIDATVTVAAWTAVSIDKEIK